MNRVISTEKLDFLTQPWKLTTVSALAAEDAEYLALDVEDLTGGREVDFDIFLRVCRDGTEATEMAVFIPQGTEIPGERKMKLQDAGISKVYVHQRDLDRLVKYLDSLLPAMLSDEALSTVQKAEKVSQATLLWVRHFFSDPRFQNVAELNCGFQYVNHLLGAISRDAFYRSWIMELCQRDRTLYSHCLHTSLLAMAFTHYLGWPESKSQDLGRAALLHDIGLTRVPEEILKKPGALDEAEWELIKKHPRTGFTLLEAFSLLNRNALLTVLQHHENIDGSGYPNGLKSYQIHPMARILRIIDSFESLTSPRYWRSAHEPYQALWIMRQDWQTSGAFDASLLVNFIKFLSGE